MYEDNNAQGAPARGLVRVVLTKTTSRLKEPPGRGLVRVAIDEDNVKVQGAPARGLVSVAMYEDNNAQGAPARGLVRVAIDEDNVKAQGAPARGLVRVAMDEDNVKVQEAPARGLVKVGTGNHHQISRSPACHRSDQNRNAKNYRLTAARFLFIKDGMEAIEVSRVRCLGGHMCDRNQPLMEETRPQTWS
ncbi:glutamine-rich protein 2 [Plakobranchus ocellatus]|uniref:Glutamine-rich protein 2 n=1 Tax=Plakobranchus ocellatus TaxID=259542 RepID=A0AAV4B9H5_9GAST|nr:glutamine-rich protein 2 [Plakobranchus ocellatus]